jgi:hypothetical protein
MVRRRASNIWLIINNHGELHFSISFFTRIFTRPGSPSISMGSVYPIIIPLVAQKDDPGSVVNNLDAIGWQDAVTRIFTNARRAMMQRWANYLNQLKANGQYIKPDVD